MGESEVIPHAIAVVRIFAVITSRCALRHKVTCRYSLLRASSNLKLWELEASPCTKWGSTGDTKIHVGLSSPLLGIDEVIGVVDLWDGDTRQEFPRLCILHYLKPCTKTSIVCGVGEIR